MCYNILSIDLQVLQIKINEGGKSYFFWYLIDTKEIQKSVYI